uniref:Uncharacterized protein n=1 Tax=Timema douglasi TaxID=61478 RepID=A0A7R8VAC4_TIMDO|nr:unnamed protein product [Timema douglasi]
MENNLGETTPVHPIEIRTSISPSLAVRLNTISALAKYATEAVFSCVCTFVWINFEGLTSISSAFLLTALLMELLFNS